MNTYSAQLRASSEFQKAKKNLIDTVLKKSAEVRGVRPSTSDDLKKQYLQDIVEFQKDRGRELYYSYLSSGLGSGPFIELQDGSVKYDLITGIGVNFFGHTHPELMDAVLDGLSSDIMHGNLQPGVEVREFTQEALKHVGVSCKLRHAWLACSGTMVNEVALKIIRQKKFPRTKILAFRDCFAGRSTAMQEITDNPKYRENQPTYGEVEYLPFFDPTLGLDKSIEQTLKVMKDHFTRYPNRFAGLMIELVQGEGGFNYAPREFYVRVFEEVKKADLAIWVDEIQTFGRTGELFCYQTFCLNEYVDVVTVAKLLQASVVFFSEEFNPKAGLIAGTFVGSTAALKTGKRILELFQKEGLLGPKGKIQDLSNHFVAGLERLAHGSCTGLIKEVRALGGMIAFMPMNGTMDEVKALLMKYFDLGLVAFYAGHDPYVIRMLPPMGVLTKDQIDDILKIIEKGLLELGKKS